MSLDSLHVALEVGEVLLLVEAGLGETERVDNVVDLLGTALKSLGLLPATISSETQSSIYKASEEAKHTQQRGYHQCCRVKHMSALGECLDELRMQDLLDLALLDGDHLAVSLVDDVINSAAGSHLSMSNNGRRRLGGRKKGK